MSLVFEKYIEGTTLKRSDGSKVNRKINLFFNGESEINKLEKLDPFCKDLQDGSVTGTLSKQFELTVDDGSQVHKIPLVIWITPNDKDRGSDFDKRMDKAARFSGISELQGMYIYRNNRLIDFPGWKKILKHDPHMTCLRWEVHFPPKLDHIFQLDPSKREIQIPKQLFDMMSKLSRTSYKWHDDDSKAVNHRKRARERQGGKDKPTIVTTRPSSPPVTVTPGRPASPIQPSSPTNPSPTTTATASTQPQPLKGVKIKKLAGSITGQLFVSERQEGDKLSVTLNTKHALYKSFIEEIKKQ